MRIRPFKPSRMISGVFLAAGLFLLNLHAETDSPVLGTGRGIDHVVILVRDLAESEMLFRDSLGFTLGSKGKHPGGTANTGIRLKNNTYLELVTVYDRQKAALAQPEMIQFLDKHEGAPFLGLATSSAATTAAHLRSRGFDVEGPEGGFWTPEGVTEKLPELWKSVGFRKSPVPGEIIFFIEYNTAVREQLQERFPQLKRDPAKTVHANGAMGIYAVWLTVKNLRAATGAYRRVGFKKGHRFDLPSVGATAREIQAGTGVILLVTAAGTGGSTASFLNDRGESVMGVSLEVPNLATTRALLAQRMHRELPVYSGPYGKSIAVPGELARGVWVEFFERRR